MKLGERLKEAVRTKDIATISKIVNMLRFKFSFNYQDLYDYALEKTGIELQDWESLLYEIDDN